MTTSIKSTFAHSVFSAALVIVLCLILTGCPSGKTNLNVSGRIPAENSPLDDRFTLVFDEEVAWPTNPDSVIRVVPDVEGTLETGPNFLSFQSDTFPDNTVITVTLDEGLASVAERRIAPAHRVLRFPAFDFRPVRVWLIEERTTGDDAPDVVLGVKFPVPVNTSALEGRLTISDADGQTLAPSIEEGSNPETLRVIVKRPARTPVKLRFAQGLPDASGAVALREAVNLYWGESLELGEVRWTGFAKGAPELSLPFSHPVTADDLSKHLFFKTDAGAPVSFTLRSGVASNRHATLELAEPARLQMTVEAGLAAPNGPVLPEPITRFLSYRPEPLQISEAHFHADDEAGFGLSVTFNLPVSIEALREHLSIIPAPEDLQVTGGQASRFTLAGGFLSEQDYTIRIEAGMDYAEGFTLQEPVIHHVRTGTVPPLLSFGEEGKMYFPRAAQPELPMTTRNIDTVDITVSRLFPSNIAVSLREFYQGYFHRAFPEQWCEKLTTVTRDVSHIEDRAVTHELDLAALLPDDRRGLFFIEAADKDGHGEASKAVLLTQLGVLAHWQNDQLAAYVHDLRSADPVPGATLTVYSEKNQVLGTAVTRDDGTVIMTDFDDAKGGPLVVVVENGPDYTFLELETQSDDERQFSASMRRFDRDGYTALIYADRELYRPGETVHLHWMARTGYGPAAPAMPLELEVLKPNGKPLEKETVTLSQWGTGGYDVETQQAYPTGRYRAVLTIPGSGTPIGQYTFSLEEFVPNRMKAELKLDLDYLKEGEAAEATLHAEHLFGGGASDRKAQLEAVFQKSARGPQGWDDYHFANDTDFDAQTVPLGEQRTDSNGNAVFELNYTPPQNATFPLRAEITGRVFELGGRSVSDRTTITFFPADVLLGLAGRSGGGEALTVKAAAVNPDGSPAALAGVTVKLERRIWDHHVRRFYGHHATSYGSRYEEVRRVDINVKEGRGEASLKLPHNGSYRITLSSPGTPQYAQLNAYRYGNHLTIGGQAEPELVKLSLDAEHYSTGDTARLRIDCAFDGKAVVVLQGEQFKEIRTVDIVDSRAEVSVSLDATCVPNVWAEVTAINPPRGQGDRSQPFSGFAMINIPVRDMARQLAVTLRDLPGEVRPETSLALGVHIADQSGAPVSAQFTLAAVDEGIHQITGYKAQDPYDWLMQTRRPDYRRAHYYDKLASDFMKAPIGGDMGAGLANRASAVGENWIKPVALWSGPVTTDSEGNAEVRLDIPDFTGQLRFIVLAAGKEAVGMARERCHVRREHSLRTSMPRFMLPGDTARCTAVVFNHTDSPVSAQLSCETEGPLVAEFTDAVTLELPAHGEVSTAVAFTAGDAPGQAVILWRVSINGPDGDRLNSFEQRAALPVRPPAAYQSAYEFVVLEPGQEREFTPEGFLENQALELELAASASPLLRVQEGLRYLVEYPYGCAEQTVSRLMPVYVLRADPTVATAMPDTASSVRATLQAGIARLFAMQTHTGGLGYWPGSSETYPYASVYALHFLTLVRNDREFNLPGANMDMLTSYVRELARDWSDYSDSANYLRAYAVFTLSLGGDLQAIESIRQFDTVKLPRAARLLLAAALARATDDPDRVSMYLRDTPVTDFDDRTQGGVLNSELRNKAVELLALHRAGVQPETRDIRAQELMRFLRNRKNWTTQEVAFAVTALAEYLGASDVAPEAMQLRIEAPDRVLDLTGEQPFQRVFAGPGSSFLVRNTGNQGDFYLHVVRRGIPENMDLPAVSEGMSVSRRFYGRLDGAPVAPGEALLRGETYIGALSVECDAPLENVVVVDLLPAGLEIENPRLDDTSNVNLPDLDGGTAWPSHLDLRDDRLIAAFNVLGKGRHNLFYVARAVTPGGYAWPGAEAECMYDPIVRARSVAERLEVVE